MADKDPTRMSQNRSSSKEPVHKRLDINKDMKGKSHISPVPPPKEKKFKIWRP